MADQEAESIENLDQTEQTIASNGLVYNIVFNARDLTKSIIKSPIYVCDDRKFQIILNLEASPISISISCNDSLNNFLDTNFDFFVSNRNLSQSLYFNESSPAPFEVHLDFDNINQKNGWIQNDSFRTVLVIKDKNTKETANDQQANKNHIHPLITQAKEKIEWSIPELSEFHSSESYDIKFAEVVFILLLDEDYYTFQMSFDNMVKKELFIKAKLTLHNSDPNKNIIKNIYECVTQSDQQTKQMIIKEVKPEELTVDNGWIIDDCLKFTIEFTHSQRKLPNRSPRKIDFNNLNQKQINLYKLPANDYIQSLPIMGQYELILEPTIDDISNKVYQRKIRVGTIFVTFLLDVSKKIASFEFEDLDEKMHFYAIIFVRFSNKKSFDTSETYLTQNVSKENSSISFDSPFDSETVQEDWLFGVKEDQTTAKGHLHILINFELVTDFGNINPYEPIEIQKSLNNKYYIDIEIPQTHFNSPLIFLPPFTFDDKKITIFIEPQEDRIYFSGYLAGFADTIIDGKIFAINRQNSKQTFLCSLDSFKGFSMNTVTSEITANELLNPESPYISKDTFTSLFRFTFMTVKDSKVYLPIEPQFEKYVTYESDSEISAKNSKTFSVQRPIATEKYSGLINQGATCYMNSMLQALFHLPAFRRIVYNMPTSGTEDPDRNIPLNLQRLFCEMQFSANKEACSTEGLTKSFGWGSRETFVQHDVVEFCRVLMDNLMMKMKGDPSLENSINQLFEVKAQHAIRCVNVDYASITKESLMDIQLNVKNCQNLEESFEQYLEKEVMDGNNQYSTDTHGKQDAVICDEFLEFPPVLHLHLKRFIFDYETMKMTKLNDYYEFPEQIDLSKFLAKDAPGLSKSNLYDLYGVLVHAGGILGGHYNAYLRTSTSKQWYFFNDSHVTPVSTYKAVRANYGYTKSDEKAAFCSFDFLGNKDDVEEQSIINENKKKNKDENNNGGNNASDDEKKEDVSHFDTTKNGYLLIYVRHEDAPRLFAPIPEESVPKHLIEYVKEHEERKSWYLNSSSSYYGYGSSEKSFKLNFTHEDDMKLITVDSSDSDSTMKNNKYMKVFKGSGQMTKKQIYEMATKAYNCKEDEIRIWGCTMNNVPSSVIMNNDDKLKVEQYFTRNLYFFVQKKKADEKLEIPKNHILLLLKFFFPGKEYPLQYLNSAIVEKNKDLVNIFSNCCELVINQLNLPKDIKLLAYIENLYGIPQDIRTYLNRAYHYIDNGNILIFAPEPKSNINLDTINFEFTQPLKTVTEEETTNTNNSNSNSNNNLNLSSSNSIDIVSSSNSIENVNSGNFGGGVCVLGGDDVDVPVFNFSDYFDDLNVKTVTGYFLCKNSIEFLVYDLKKQMKPLFKIITPSKIKSELVKEKIIEFANLDYNFNTDSLILLSLGINFNKQLEIQAIDTKYQNITFENVFKHDLSELRVSCNHLYFLHCKNFNYENSSRFINFPNIMFSYDAKSLDFLFCLPMRRSMNLFTLVEVVKNVVEGVDIGEGPFRFLKISTSKINEVFNDDEEDSKSVISFDAASQFRLEVVPNSQRQEVLVANDAFLVNTCYARETQYSVEAYGIPFVFDVRKDEIFADTLVRLRKFMDVPETDNLESYRFMISNDNSFFTKKFTEMLDGMKMFDKCNPKSQFFIFSAESERKEVVAKKTNDIKIYN